MHGHMNVKCRHRRVKQRQGIVRFLYRNWWSEKEKIHMISEVLNFMVSTHKLQQMYKIEYIFI